MTIPDTFELVSSGERRLDVRAARTRLCEWARAGGADLDAVEKMVRSISIRDEPGQDFVLDYILDGVKRELRVYVIG